MLSLLAMRARILTLIIMLLVVGGGAFALTRLQVELLPDVDFPLVTITAIYPQAPPETVLQDVTIPLEEAVSGLDGLDTVRSISSPNLSIVLAEFEFGTDMPEVERTVSERLGALALPAGVRPPRVTRVNPDEFPILQLSVLSDRSPQELLGLVTSQVLPEIQAAPGVFSAEVPLGSRAGTAITRTNGQPSLAITVIKDPDANTVDVVDAVMERLESAKAGLPEDVEFVTIADQAPGIKSSIETLQREVGLGAVFAVLVIFAFLLSARPTLVTSVSIPVSVFAAFIVMGWQEMSLNIITLGALAIAVGRVVDDSIVVTENIYRHIQRGEDRRQAALAATREVALPITTSTLTTIAVFAPLAFIKGIIGTFFLPFALTITFALLASLFVALTIVPVLGSLFIQPGGKGEAAGAWIQRLYIPSLQWALAHKGWTLLGAAVTFIASLGLLAFIPQSFLPGFEQNLLTIDMTVPPGATGEEALAELDQVEARLAELRAEGTVITYQSTMGAGDPFGPGGGFSSSGGANLLVLLQEEVDAEGIAAMLREELAADRRTVLIAQAQGGGPQSNLLELTLLGQDYGAVAAAAERLAEALRGTEGLINIRTDAVTAGDDPRPAGLLPIIRVNSQRAVTITGAITDPNTQGMNRKVTRIVQEVGLPEGVALATGGVFADIAQAFAQMGIAMIVGVALVYLVMVFSQRSLVTPFVIILSLPLASIGALGALFITQRSLGVSALLGLLMLIGLVVTNAIVLIAFVEQLRTQGLRVYEALIQGARTRLRPVLMTAFTTSFALLPLGVIVSESSGIIGAELATVVIGGLMTSTFLTLVVIPVVYSLLRRDRTFPRMAGASDETA